MYFPLRRVVPLAGNGHLLGLNLGTRDGLLPDFLRADAIGEVALAPNAEITVFPWTSPPELKDRTIDRVRRFLKAHSAAH